MKKLIKKTVAWVLVFTLLWPNVVFAQTALSGSNEQEIPVPVQENLAPESGVQVLEATARGIVLELITPDLDMHEALAESGPCAALSVAGYGEMDKAGWPRLPVMGALVGIPQHAEPALSILAADFVILPGAYALCPVAQLLYAIDLEGQSTYKGEAVIPDAAAYATDSFYPAEVVEIAETGSMRDQRVAQLRFHPFQYNPVTGVVKHYTRIRVLLQFGAAGETTDAGIAEQRSSTSAEGAFDHLLAQIVVNYDEARQWRETPSSRSTLLRQQVNASVPSSPTYKLTVDEDGLYEVTYAELAAAGVPVEAIDPRTFTLHTQGTEVALYVSGQSDGVFGPEDAIIFYGEKVNTKFTDINAYWLTWGGLDGLRMTELDGTPTGSGALPEGFRTLQNIEQNRIYQSSRPSGADEDRWYSSFIWATAPTTSYYTTTLYAPITDTVSATIRGLFKGYDATPQHHTRVLLNEHLIVDATWARQADYAFAVNVPASILVAGVNTITVQVPLDMGITGDYFLVNRFEIDYDRRYVAVADSLRFNTTITGTCEYTVTGFTTATVQAFDITIPTTPVHILNVASEPDGSTYAAYFEQTIDNEHTYLVSTPAQFKSVLSIVADQPSDLHAVTNGADYIVITHGSFYTGVLPLVNYRATQGLRAMAVDVQDIYDEFSAGVFDPNAIHDFLAYAYTNWTSPAPAYVLLMGDGNYDFKNYTGRGELNYVPPFLADVDPWLGEAAADNRYVCVSGEDNFPDMHLGRLPVKTSAEAQNVVTKILDYEQNPATGDWNQKVLFATDNPDSAGDFYTYSDVIVNNYLPAPYVGDKVYYGRTHTNASAARSAILSAINEGRLIVNYVGHGARSYWASEQLLKYTDANAFTNVGRLPFLVPMACLDGYYITPSSSSTDLSSTAEALVRAPGKGAIASWSATGMGMAFAHDYLNKGLFEAIFFDNIIQLGPATLQGKLYLYTRTGYYRDQIDTYLLFGDPAVRLNVLPTDISLTQTVIAPDVLVSGDNITYTLSFTNTGPATAQHVVIDNALSTALVDLVVTSDGPTIITRTGSAIIWNVADLAAGEGGGITITATISETFTGVLINVPSIATSAVDSDETNNRPDPMATAVYVNPEDPTAVDLVSFTARPRANTLLLEWETVNELDTAGFNLYRAESIDAPSHRLNSQLIPAQSPGDVLGAAYTFTANTATPATAYLYWLEDISFRGVATLYGPITTTITRISEIKPPLHLPLTVRAL